MWNIEAKICENFASYRNDADGKMLFVESFDNHEFEVRYGSIEQNTALGTVVADTDQALQQGILNLLNKVKP